MSNLLVTVNVNAFYRLIAVDMLDLSIHEDGMMHEVFIRMHEAPLHLVLQLHVVLRRQAETRSADSQRSTLNTASMHLTRVLSENSCTGFCLTS